MPEHARRQCGAMAAHFRLLETDPGFRARQSRLEQATQRLAHAPERRRTPIRIQVVVHVVWRTAGRESLEASDRESDRRPEPRLPRPGSGSQAGAGGLAGAGGRRRHRVRAREPRSRRPAQRRDHAHADHAHLVRNRRLGQVVEDRRRGRLAERSLPEPVGVYAERRAARLRAVPRRPEADRRGRDHLQRLRNLGHRAGALRPRAHGRARGRPLAEPAPHLGRHRGLQRIGSASPTRRTPPARTTAGRASRTSPARTARAATCS